MITYVFKKKSQNMESFVAALTISPSKKLLCELTTLPRLTFKSGDE